MKFSYQRILIKSFSSLSPRNSAGTSIDARIIKTGFDPNTYRSNYQINNLLKNGHLTQARLLLDQMPLQNTISMNTMMSGYVKSGDLSSARHLFDTMTDRNAITWAILIGGYSRFDRFNEAFELLVCMYRSSGKSDYVTFASLLSGCNDPAMLNELSQIHSHVVKLGHDSAIIVCNSLVDSYCKMHRIDLARKVFEDMPERDSVSYNALMTGFGKEGLNEEAIKLFVKMQNLGLEASDFTVQAVLCAAVGLDNVAFGEQIHGFAVKNNLVSNVFVGNALLNFYSKHDCVNEAWEFFCRMPEKDGVSYNVMITAYSWIGEYRESIRIFWELQFTNFDRRNYPFATLFSIAANKLDLRMGKQLHSQAIVTTADLDVQVANSLVDMYAKCGIFEDAERIFVKLSSQSTVPWTAIISAKIQKGLVEEGLKLFNKMRIDNVNPDQATFASLLKACASLALKSLGKQLHSCIIRSGFFSNVYSGCALVDMYAKCGSLEDAIQTFKEMPEKGTVSWNAMISAYAQNGDGESTLKSFQEMVLSGYRPDSEGKI